MEYELKCFALRLALVFTRRRQRHQGNGTDIVHSDADTTDRTSLHTLQCGCMSSDSFFFFTSVIFFSYILCIGHCQREPKIKTFTASNCFTVILVHMTRNLNNKVAVVALH